jgi:hypothetical protein
LAAFLAYLAFLATASGFVVYYHTQISNRSNSTSLQRSDLGLKLVSRDSRTGNLSASALENKGGAISSPKIVGSSTVNVSETEKQLNTFGLTTVTGNIKINIEGVPSKVVLLFRDTDLTQIKKIQDQLKKYAVKEVIAQKRPDTISGSFNIYYYLKNDSEEEKDMKDSADFVKYLLGEIDKTLVRNSVIFPMRSNSELSFPKSEEPRTIWITLP